jgi:hypothetical protein
VPSAPRLFDNGVEGNDQLYSPYLEYFPCEDLEMHPSMCKQMLCYVVYAFYLHVGRVPGMQVGHDDIPTRFLMMSFCDIKHVDRVWEALCCHIHLAIFVVELKATSAQSLDSEIHTCICSTADERPPQFGVFWLISIIVNQPTSHPWNAPAIQIAVANIVSYKSESQYLILVLS